MMHHTRLEHQFVENMPEQIEPGILYVSMRYATTIHRCCCGCGIQVVTPLSPRDWQLVFDGETISLRPSIGNWNFPCRSHYFIRRNRAVEAEPMRHLKRARHNKKRWKKNFGSAENVLAGARGASDTQSKRHGGFWDTLKRWWGSRP